jgi:hypothetical protein
MYKQYLRLLLAPAANDDADFYNAEADLADNWRGQMQVKRRRGAVSAETYTEAEATGYVKKVVFVS